MQFIVTKYRTNGMRENTLVDNYGTAAILAQHIENVEGCPVTVEQVYTIRRNRR